MALNDVYQIKVFQEMPNAPDILNVFYYRCLSDSASNAEDLLSEFDSNVWDVVRDMLIPNLNTVRYEVINGNNNLDWKEQVVANPGLNIATAPCAPHIVAAFQAPRSYAGTRYSYKRFSGIPSTFMDTGDGSWNSTLQDLAYYTGVALGTELEGADGTYRPTQIRGGFQLGVPPVVVQYLQGQWAFNVFPSHQNTRQYIEYALPSNPA